MTPAKIPKLSESVGEFVCEHCHHRFITELGLLIHQNDEACPPPFKVNVTDANTNQFVKSQRFAKYDSASSLAMKHVSSHCYVTITDLNCGRVVFKAGGGRIPKEEHVAPEVRWP